MNKFLRRLELINTNVETARNDLPITHDTFRRIRCKIKFRYRHCCVSVIMQPAGYLLSPRVAHGAIWDPWCRMWCTNTSILNMIRFPDGEQTGFCNSEPDWTGFWKRLYRDQTKLITAFKSLIRVIFGYELDRIKYLDSITGLGSDLIT